MSDIKSYLSTPDNMPPECDQADAPGPKLRKDGGKSGPGYENADSNNKDELSMGKQSKNTNSVRD